MKISTILTTDECKDIQNRIVINDISNITKSENVRKPQEREGIQLPSAEELDQVLNDSEIELD